jgi:NAD+ kinase
MTLNPASPQKIAVLVHPNIPQALEIGKEVVALIRSLGGDAESGSLNDNVLRKSVQARIFDLVIALGGDGTMLRAGHLCAPADIPLLGINIGTFGFLVELKRDQWREYLPRLFAGEFRYEKRMMLQAHCTSFGKKQGPFDVINDVVVARGQHVRPIKVEALLNGEHISSYMADGLIAATPTGSTAYALAAGGPILPPEIRNILLMPVAPHLSVDRAVVLSEGSTVTMRVTTAHEAVVSVDGQPPVKMTTEDYVEVAAHEKSLLMVRFQDPNYFYRNLTAYMEHNPVLGIRPNDRSS